MTKRRNVMANKSGKSDLMTLVIVLAIVGVVAYMGNFSGFQDTVKGFLGKSSATGSSNNVGSNLQTSTCPSTGTTSVTLNTHDKLATAATNVQAEYYIFDGNTLVKSGTTSAGTASFDLTCGKSYKGIVLNTTAGTGAYAETFTVDAFAASSTQNLNLVQFGGAQIKKIYQTDLTSNISLASNGNSAFKMDIRENVSNKGYNKPIILCQANVSSISSVTLDSQVTSTAIPSRISPTSGYKYYAFEYPKMLDQTIGILTLSGTITAGSTAPATTDSMSCIVVDQATWKKAQYSSLSLDDGFKTGPENTESSNADVGAVDSPASSLYFNGA